MFGSIGFPELMLIFVVALLLFGPKKLPEVAKFLGKAVRDFRSAVNEAKSTIEEEINKESLGSEFRAIDAEIKEIKNETLSSEFRAINTEIKEIKEATEKHDEKGQ